MRTPLVTNYHDGDHYDIASYVYYGGPDGLREDVATELPTQGAYAGGVVVGAE